MIRETTRLLSLRGVRVLDVVSREVHQTTVVIGNGRIVALGDEYPASAPELDLTGCWAVPSFIDMHAHVTFSARDHDHPGGFSFTEPAEVGLLRAVHNLTEAVRNGICVVRDTGGRQSQLSMTKAVLDGGALLLPELITSGEPLCLPDGHGAVFGKVVQSIEDIDHVITDHVALGHEWLKIMNGPELWPDTDLRYIVKTAHAAGLHTAVHAFTVEGISAAVYAGATTIEHGLLVDPDLTEVARAFGTLFVPTAYCSWVSLRPRFTYTQSAIELGHLDFWYRYLEQCGPAHVDAGLPVLPGTDAGCAPCTFDDYFDELACFERWGMRPIDVLRTATLDAATCLGREDRIGSIAVGKDANLVITDRDPTESTAHLRHPVLVFYRGSAVVNSLGERWA
jgi:imidazolonepropionase-like amidohydrolase